jgi:hypothetical protein
MRKTLLRIDICGILTSEKSVSLEDMEGAIALQGVERFQ